jgi:phospholipase C
MRPIYLAVLSAALGFSFTPALISGKEAVVVNQPDPDAEIAPYVTDAKSDAATNTSTIIQLIQQKVKYVFVIFQENRSFDEEYGTLPGAYGLFSQPEKDTPGFTQYILNTDGSYSTITPFRLDQEWLPWDLDDVSHAHSAMVEKMNIVNGTPLMDQFALVQEGLEFTGQTPTLKAVQYGELEMAYIDGNIIPFMWNYASKFVIFDNVFQTIIGPSSPNAIAMIAGQSGSTQWVEHPNTDAINVQPPALAAILYGVPVESDLDPLWGSAEDPTKGADGIPDTGSTDPQINLTFASLPLTLTGSAFQSLEQYDLNATADLADIQNDIAYLTALNKASVSWGWYQEGFSSSDIGGISAYIQHHNGPQYFGYVAANTEINTNLHGVDQFFTDVANGNLSSNGGVYYIRGGYQNQAKLTPLNPDPTVQQDFMGDDDHPGYSDSQLSEALVAREINAIANSQYWNQCAIIITYDESEGDYDPPQIIAWDPYGLALSRGPRIPLLVISPYAEAHAVSHELGDHNSVIKFINLIFGLTALQDLPDEAAAQQLGKELYNQDNLGPEDDPQTSVSNLLSAFSVGRLTGALAPLPASYALIRDSDITTLPHWGTDPLRTHLHITPTDHNRKNVVPSDFDPRPSSQPGFTPSPTPTP